VVPKAAYKRTVEIAIPDDALDDIDDAKLATLAREAVLIRLYEQGLISSGRAARLLNMTRWDFLDLLRRYGVSFFDETADLEQEVRDARP
jgi:predicted HTH domain antitoxin